VPPPAWSPRPARRGPATSPAPGLSVAPRPHNQRPAPAAAPVPPGLPAAWTPTRQKRRWKADSGAGGVCLAANLSRRHRAAGWLAGRLPRRPCGLPVPRCLLTRPASLLPAAACPPAGQAAAPPPHARPPGPTCRPPHRERLARLTGRLPACLAVVARLAACSLAELWPAASPGRAGQAQPGRAPPARVLPLRPLPCPGASLLGPLLWFSSATALVGRRRLGGLLGCRCRVSRYRHREPRAVFFAQRTGPGGLIPVPGMITWSS